jgi:type I restriction enzyme S subunit
MLGNIEFIAPPLLEQQAIAAYLDRQAAKIDALIAKKERLLDLLAEQRAALISQAVTKGLNPAVKMKDSGVAWLGQVPSHWEVKKLKHVVSKIGSGKTPRGGSEVYSNEGVVFIRSQNVHFNGLRLDDVVYIDTEMDEEMRSTRVQPNDVLLNITGASLGRATVAPESLPPTNVNQHVSIIRPDTGKIIPQFLNAIIGSQVVQAQIFSTENGAAREGLPYSKIANLIFAMPVELEEQKAIAKHLDYQTKRLTDLATKVETAIERLREYRAALISSAVTGKIQV